MRDLLEIAAGHELSEDELCDLLGRVGLCADEYIGRELDSGLSGGEMKRVEIASVLARRAPLCIFDEPEAGIDLWSFARLVETFQDLRASRCASSTSPKPVLICGALPVWLRPSRICAHPVRARCSSSRIRSVFCPSRTRLLSLLTAVSVRPAQLRSFCLCCWPMSPRRAVRLERSVLPYE